VCPLGLLIRVESLQLLCHKPINIDPLASRRKRYSFIVKQDCSS
jgi:hypothetical protein